MKENGKEGREREQKSTTKCTEGKRSERTERDRERAGDIYINSGSGKMSQQNRERRRLIAWRERGKEGGGGGVEREKAGMAFFIEQLCACNPNQWVISTSLATNIYLKLFTEGRAVQLESRRQR